jgi:plastocyanin
LRKVIVITAAAATLTVTATTAFAATKTVRVGDNWFVQARGVPTVTVRTVDTVRFRWVGERAHNVVSQGGGQRIDSGRPKTSGSYSVRVRRRGTYLLVCEVHGRRDQSMRLVVR